MAKEITALGGARERDGSVRWRLFYHFPINPVVVNARGQTVVPVPSSALPADVVALMTQAERDSLSAGLDAGTVGFAMREVEQTAGEATPAFVERLKLHWAATRDFTVQQWRDQNANTGTTVTI